MVSMCHMKLALRRARCIKSARGTVFRIQFSILFAFLGLIPSSHIIDEIDIAIRSGRNRSQLRYYGRSWFCLVYGLYVVCQK